ncbi:putative voltage-gated chloride channel [Aspergillus uvarum CBS 121591]|uniref:Chloride channel protein n=1 Tax=Aspergillus uvarum CBS 121591 TaxID=1448315 RepID=A0A319CCV7_9EURO|nr:putative voltage-gated chloride channel [Aspergillus uvarum CBS 121591]PYH82994.1 putative voltage-gated chloride channel [Aspergillus uvarum CBS 121591]
MSLPHAGSGIGAQASPSQSYSDDPSPQSEPPNSDTYPRSSRASLSGGLREPISFKRKQKQRSRFSLSRLFPGEATREASFGSPHSDRQPPNGHSLSSRDVSNSNGNLNHKDSGFLDWYVEGPGRRVGYDDLTAIDWIFEYTKERQRKRLLYANGQGLVGYARKILDASNVWIVLIATGILVGIIAACIDVSSDWLADLKTGYCRNGAGGGRFYLNRSFCCWGHDDINNCLDWTPWRKALGVTSRGGGYAVEYVFYILYSVFFAVCACVLVRTYAIYAKHSGIPEIKTVLGGFVIRHFMGPWTLAIKSLGLCLAVASGMWLGKEGPLVHVACCCASLIMKPFHSLNHNEARKREVLSAAAAAGISVAFGAPIGGVLFSLEQLSYYFPDKTMWQSFVCAMVASVTLHALDPFRTGNIVLYQVKYTHGWHRFEIIPFVILGIVGGLYGAFFIRLNMKVANWRRSLSVPRPILEVSAVALLSSLINFPNLFMKAQNSELVHSLFAECSTGSEDPFGFCKVGAVSASTVALLLGAAILGFFLASITFGLDIPAGIILPSIAIGALYGRALGIVFRMWQQAFPKFFLFGSCEPDVQCVTPGIYAIIGAASALGGATRMTVSIVVIMFELTGALTYVIPIMIAVMLSKWCGDIFGKRGIYESWIQLKEYPFLDHRDDTAPPDVSAQKVMTSIDDLTVITAVGHTIDTLRNLLLTTSYRGYPVVIDMSNPVLLGYISRNELSYALKYAASPSENELSSTAQVFFTHQPFADPSETLDLRPWMDQTPITLNSNTTFLIVLRMFQRLGLRYVLFADKGVLQGLLTKKDVWSIVSGSGSHKDETLLERTFTQPSAAEEVGLLGDDDRTSLASSIERRQSL